MRKRKPNKKDRHWQHEDTGMVCVSWYKPSKRWYRITQAQYQDYLSAQQSVQPTPPLALSCECGSLYGVHEKFCPKYKSAGG